MYDYDLDRLCTIVYSCRASAWVEKSQSDLIFGVWVDVSET